MGVALPDKLKQTAVALKALYDEDIIEEVRLASSASCWVRINQRPRPQMQMRL